jgi:hypothetical protein
MTAGMRLPPTLYKYLDSRHANELVLTGTVLLQTLAYFANCEDERGDPLEGTHLYEPEGGLQVETRAGAQLRVPGGMPSRVREPDKLFVYCTSLVRDPGLAVKWRYDACVEIFDTERFLARLRAAVRRKSQAKAKTFIHGEVQYYSTELPPGTAWALPARIVMSKPRRFADECEYRFAFSLKADALQLHNVEIKIGHEGLPDREAPTSGTMFLKLGAMSDCCKRIQLQETATPLCGGSRDSKR